MNLHDYEKQGQISGPRFYQEECIVYEETFVAVARFESIRMILVFAWHKDFILYQMDVKSVFLNEYI